jgi:surfactin synthase thioesterase subunit
MIDEQLEFAPWVKRFPADGTGAAVIFPHAGGAAAAYRTLAMALSGRGVDTYIVQYPQRADRLAHPAAGTLEDLAAELFDAGPWDRVAPLRLFGHCMGSLVAFEFAKIAERRGVEVAQLWASAGQAPSTVAGSAPAPTTERELLADIVDLGGTDPRLLADEDFLELLLPAVRADYQAFNRYACGADVRIRADIHAVGGDKDHRVAEELLRRWEIHTDAVFTMTLLDGGHFYIDDHIDTVAELVSWT